MDGSTNLRAKEKAIMSTISHWLIMEGESGASEFDDVELVPLGSAESLEVAKSHAEEHVRLAGEDLEGWAWMADSVRERIYAPEQGTATMYIRLRMIPFYDRRVA